MRIPLFDFTFKNKIVTLSHTSRAVTADHISILSRKVQRMSSEFRIRHLNKNILIVAASESDANMLYATHFFAPDPFIFIRTSGGKRHLVMNDLEIGRARSQSNAHIVHSLSAYTTMARQAMGKAPTAIDTLVVILRDFNIRSVAVPSTFPVSIADGLRKQRIRVTPLPDPFFPERIYKRPVEIANIKKAMRATERGMKAALSVLRESRVQRDRLVYGGSTLTAERLRGVINTTILEQGYVPSGTIVAPGKQGCDPHNRGSGVIRANEPVIIDIFPRGEDTGYYADITRTFVKGKASEFVTKMHRAVRAGQTLGVQMVRHGAKTKELHTAIVKLFESRGFTTGEKAGKMEGFFHSTGHGLGLDIHEPPRVGANSSILEKGMVVTIEPGLYYHPHGGVRIEDTVLVTRSGVENLTRFPKFLEV